MIANEKLLKKFAKGSTSVKSEATGLNCVIYTRVSSKEQADTNKSLEWQKKYCLEYAQKQNMNILGYFGGTYESAKSDERKEFSRMLKFVKTIKEKVSNILVYSLDRFSRTGDSAIYIAGELKKTGVNIIAVTQPIDTSTHSGLLHQNIQFVFGKYDNDLRRQKCMDGMREKLLSGEWLGNTPIGYSYDRTHSTSEQRIIINDKGKLIKQAFEWRAQGRTYEEIVVKLENLGLKIHFQMLTDIFRNPFYCGILSNNLLNGEMVAGKHPALISEDLFLKVNNLSKTNGYKVKIADENLPLRRFVNHEESSHPFTGYIVKKKSKYYYKVNKPGVKVNRSIEIMHEKFKEFLGQYSIPEKAIEPLKLQLQYTWENSMESNADLKKSVATKLTEIENKLEKLEERHAYGEINMDVFNKYSAKLIEEKTKISDEWEKLTGKLSNPEKLISFTCALASKLATVWDDSDYYQKRNLQFLLFPDGVLYNSEKEHYRTLKVNYVFEYVSLLARVLEEEKNGSSGFNPDYSRSVERSGELSNFFVEDLERFILCFA